MSVPNLSIRGCRPSDLTDVCRIEEACYGNTDALHRIALRQFLDLSGPAFAVAEISSAIAGFAIGGVALDQDDQRFGWLLDVAILPKFQGQSVGPAVCRHVLDQLVRCGIQTVRATVSPSNEWSLHMLNRLEFSVIGDIADYFGPGQRRFLMEWRCKE